MNTVASLPAKLLACPFCGAEDVALWHANNQWRVGCAACGASPGPDRNNRTKDAAITAWNRRALATPAVEGGLPEGHPQAPMPAGWLTLAVPGGTESGRDFVHGPRRAIEVCQRALLAAAAEQPGSAVQGENREQEAAALAKILRRFSAELSLHERASLTIAVQVLSGTTPPPAPAATYATPDDVALTMGPDDIPHLLIAGAEVARFPKGSWAEVCEAFDFGGYRYGPPAPAAEQDGYSLRMPEVVLLPATQPEARGVEELRGLVRLWRTVEKNGERVTQFDKGYEQASDECADALETVLNSLATPNPVRAEQPCTCPQHPDDVIPCPRHRAEQPEGKGEWPKNLFVLGAPIHAVYVPPGYAIDGVAMRDERVLRFVAAAPAAPGAGVGVDAEELRRALCQIGVVGNIDGHDVIRRESVLDIIDRRRAALAGKESA